MKVLIVGGVAGGASTAARLRRLSEDAEIVMFERGEYISFANCGLPYYIGGEITEKSALTLQTPESFNRRFNVDVRIFNEVVAIDPKKKEVKVLNHKTNETYTEGYDKLVLSMGAEPIKPPLPGIDAPGIFTLRNIPDTYKIKDYLENNNCKRAVVVGGGYIGVEMAENLVAAGLDVSIVEMQDQVIAPLDFEMACEVQNHLMSKGVKLYLKHAVKGFKKAEELIVEIDDQELATDIVILAIGVKPDTKIAKEAGLTLNERGAIIVNDSLVTSNKDIYAVGDAIEVVDFITGNKVMIPLAGPANKQGRIVANNICGDKTKYTGTQGSSILKVFELTVATTGINEKTAKRLNLNYEKTYTYSGSHAGYYPKATSMSVKTIFEKETGRILGAQIVGYDGVDKRCDVFAAAIRFKATASDLTELELCYAPPYSSAKDPVNMAGYTIENILNKKVEIFHWHEVATLPRDGSVTLLDTRTPIEYQNGHIDGFVNIPVDELRQRLNEIDPNKMIYLTCQIGLRGYIACRILKENGFKCKNLSGGYRLYNVIFGKKPVFKEVEKSPRSKSLANSGSTITVNACGLQCPGPIVKLSAALKDANIGDVVEISTTDPAFSSDIEGFCRRTGNTLLESRSDAGVNIMKIQKGEEQVDACSTNANNSKNIIVFSGDLDKAIASLIIANASAALGRKVSVFFTFWGLNILRKSEKVKVKKDFMGRMFGMMMPRGTKKLGLSKMNMGGMGAKMIRAVMKNKNIDSMEDLLMQAQASGVELIACSMSMDVMGIKLEELIDGVKIGGAAAMIANAEESDMSLFI